MRHPERAFAAAAELAQAGVGYINGRTHGAKEHCPCGGVTACGNGVQEPRAEALKVYNDLRNIDVKSRRPV